MKPRKSIKLDVPLPEGLLTLTHDTSFRAFLARSAVEALNRLCDPKWVDKQHIAHLQACEQERRKQFRNHLQKLRAEKVQRSVPTATVTTPNSYSSKKAVVATPHPIEGKE